MDYDMRLVWFAYFCIVVVLLEIITACTEGLLTIGLRRKVRLWVRPARLSLVWSSLVIFALMGRPMLGLHVGWDFAMNGPYKEVVQTD